MRKEVDAWLLGSDKVKTSAAFIDTLKTSLKRDKDKFHNEDHLKSRNGVVAELSSVADELNIETMIQTQPGPVVDGKETTIEVTVPKWQGLGFHRPLDFNDIIVACGHRWEDFSIELEADKEKNISGRAKPIAEKGV